MAIEPRDEYSYSGKKESYSDPVTGEKITPIDPVVHENSTVVVEKQSNTLAIIAAVVLAALLIGGFFFFNNDGVVDADTKDYNATSAPSTVFDATKDAAKDATESVKDAAAEVPQAAKDATTAGDQPTTRPNADGATKQLDQK